jgi:tight adherence protein C
MLDTMPFLIGGLAFAAVTAIVVVIGGAVSRQAYVHRRLPTPVFAGADADDQDGIAGFLSPLTKNFDEKHFGIDGALRNKLRRELVRAGFFSMDAIRHYVVAKLALVIAAPIVMHILLEIWAGPFGYINLALLGMVTIIAIATPDAFIARRQRRLQQQYRIVFPDLLDMLVVCIDAGLSLDASFGRLRPEIAKRCPALGINLELLGTEMRAGKGAAEALARFAERVNLDEVKSFVLALRQSVELGTDVGDALRAFSDEMRDRRLLRAEEVANKLPVKMVVPLGTCIFPVILLSLMLPVVIRLLSVISKGG